MFLIIVLVMNAVAVSCGSENPERAGSMLNGHLKVAAEPYEPFFIYYCSSEGEKRVMRRTERRCEGNETYGGALWHLLEFFHHARNVTFTIIRAPDRAWGTCYGKKNCTGMIGMVNRREVDFAVGRSLCHFDRVSNIVSLRSFHTNSKQITSCGFYLIYSYAWILYNYISPEAPK